MAENRAPVVQSISDNGSISVSRFIGTPRTGSFGSKWWEHNDNEMLGFEGEKVEPQGRFLEVEILRKCLI